MNPQNLSQFYEQQGQRLPSVAERQAIAAQAGIQNYSGTASQNAQLLGYLQNQNNTINLGQVDFDVTPLPNNVIATQQAPVVPPISFPPVQERPETEEERLLRRRAELEGEVSQLEQRIATRGDRQNQAYDDAGVFEDMQRLVGLRDQLRAAQDREAEIPIEARQELRGRGATRTEFQQTITPRLESQALQALASSRQVSSLSEIINTNMAIVDQRINAERERDEFLFNQRNSQLQAVESAYSSILSDRQKVALEEAKFQNELYKITFQDDLSRREYIMKQSMEKGINFDPNASTNELYDNFISQSSPADETSLILYNLDNMLDRFEKLTTSTGLGANVGTSALTRGLFAGNAVAGLTGKNADWRAEANFLLSDAGLDYIIETLNQVNLAPVSDPEIALIRSAFSALRPDENGRFRVTEEKFKSEVNNIMNRIKINAINDIRGTNYINSQNFSSLNQQQINNEYQVAKDLLQIRSAEAEMLRNNQSVGSFIGQQEGFSPTAYQDQAGVWTIGYGATQINGRPVRPGDTITQQQATQLMEQDIARHSNFSNLITTNLTPNQRIALASFEYNLGPNIWNSGPQARSIIDNINRGNFQAAAQAMLNFNKVRDPSSGQLVTNQGLINRRQREAQLLFA